MYTCMYTYILRYVYSKYTAFFLTIFTFPDLCNCYLGYTSILSKILLNSFFHQNSELFVH